MISAGRQTSARSTVCLLQTMTVHPCSKSSRATGLPTILDLPITTARLPLRSGTTRSEEHTSELQSLLRISYAVFCLNKKKVTILPTNTKYHTSIYQTKIRITHHAIKQNTKKQL